VTWIEERTAAETAAITAGLARFHEPTPENDAARALAAMLAEVDRPLPCTQRNPDLWISKSPAARELARNICGSCFANAACPSAGVTINGANADLMWEGKGRNARRRTFSPFGT